MITLNLCESGFVLGYREKESNVHLTHIRTDCFTDVVSDPRDDRTITPESSRTPYDQQWVERSVVYGSRMALVAPMHYSTPLTESIISACRSVDAIEKEELPGDESCPFFQAVADRLLELHAPVQILRAMKEDFSYILAYLPPWRAKYRLARNGSNLLAIEETSYNLARPVYLLRENSYLWDQRRRIAKVERTLGGTASVALCTFDRWDDVIKSV